LLRLYCIGGGEITFEYWALVDWLTGQNQTTDKKTCPIAAVFKTNPTWTGVGSNLGCHSGSPCSSHLSLAWSQWV